MGSKIKWTLERCIEEGSKYNNRPDFQKFSKKAYDACIRNHWLDIVREHMTSERKLPNYWTKETCQIEALKYTYRTDFHNSKGYGYGSAVNNGWIDEICKHMPILGNHKRRLIYAYEFPDNHVYVGLTYNIKERSYNRLLDSTDSVTEYILQSGLTPIIKILTEFIPIEEAKLKEGEFLQKYISEGWIKLNKRKTGGIGGSPMWSFYDCKEEALKYNNRKDLKQNNSGCLSAIYKNNWQDSLLKHMHYDKIPNDYWTYEKCIEAANLCSKRGEFQKRFVGAYSASKKHGWFDEITSHMKYTYLGGFRTKEEVSEAYQKALKESKVIKPRILLSFYLTNQVYNIHYHLNQKIL